MDQTSEKKREPVRKRDRKGIKYIRTGQGLAAFLFLGAGGLLRALSRILPGFALFWREKVNPLLVGSLGRLTGLLPFSLGEVLILAAICLVLVFAAGCLGRILTKRGGLLSYAAGGLAFLITVLSVIFFLWEANEDVYFRAPSFGETYGLLTEGYSDEDLIRTCLVLTEEINASAPLVKRDEAGLMVCGEDAGDRVIRHMQALGETYPWLSGYYPPPKMVFFSRVLSRMHFTGIYSVPTIEANINADMPPYQMPFTMAHELSHLKGVMSEKEANFTGWLAGHRSEDPDLRYSSALLGWTYCGNELGRRDREAFMEIRSGICHAALEDLQYNSNYWKGYEGAVSRKTQEVNDFYLKMEGLKEGTSSYDMVVDMIVTWMQKAGEI